MKDRIVYLTKNEGVPQDGFYIEGEHTIDGPYKTEEKADDALFPISNGIEITVSSREFNTILAALRFWQRWVDGDIRRREMQDFFMDEDPMNDGEIDALCERLNVGG